MQRAHTAAGPASAALRQDRLKRAAQLIVDNHDAIARAMDADFGHRSRYHSLVADVATTVKSLGYAADNLASWMQADPIAPPAPGMQAWIEHQPLGVVGIIAPWNFPINLAFAPLAGVFAAGNAAMLKPSELTPRTSELLAELIAHYFAPTELTVVLGDASVGAAFSGLPFDHLVFTGSTTVGRHVMRAAADNLVPVTLELGGKSPVVIAADADPAVAAERVLTVKTFNAGQICLSPDYVLITAGQTEAFVSAARRFVAQVFPTIQTNPDYTSIVSQRHYARLVGLIDDALAKGARHISLAPAGEVDFDPATRKIAPVILLDVNPSMQVMQEEIFGPILPVMAIADEAAAIGWINDHARPLAAYYFGNDKARRQYFAAHTTSGALVINDVMSHASIEELPFGGVGAAGMGAYHGIHGFRRFSHAKPVVVQSEDGATGVRLRAPYAGKLQQLEATLAR
jgi:coniferyl-aldehyde dehydrogenase